MCSSDDHAFPESCDDAAAHRDRGLSVKYITCRHGKRRMGRLVDLSDSGMRVYRIGRVRIKKGDRIGMNLTWGDTEIPVRARLSWIRKVGFMKHVLGFQFVDLAPNTIKAIQNLGRVAKVSLYFASAECEQGRNRVPMLRMIGRKGFPFNGSSAP